MLITLLKPNLVFTPVISEGGVEVFKDNDVNFEAQKKVDQIMDCTKKDICRWEKLAANRTPLDFFNLINKSSKRY